MFPWLFLTSDTVNNKGNAGTKKDKEHFVNLRNYVSLVFFTSDPINNQGNAVVFHIQPGKQQRKRRDEERRRLFVNLRNFVSLVVFNFRPGKQ